MPLPMTAGAPPGGAPPSPGGPPGQPPMGTTPAVGPTANRGHEMAARQGIGSVIKALEQLLPMVGSENELGQAIMKSITSLGKHVQPGQVDPAAEKNELQNAQIRNIQQARMAQQLRQQMGAGGGGGPGGGAAGPPGMAGAAPPPGAA